MPYSEYKKLYGKHKTVYGSYNNADKTIIVKLPDDVEYTSEQPKEREQWLEIEINPNNIKQYTDTYVLVKMPYRSEYRNWVMWVSKKIFKSNKLIFKPDFTFKISKNCETKKEIQANELLEVFSCSVYEQEYPEIHIPEKLEPIHCEALEELKDD